MACPKFDRKNKKHVIIAASVAAAIVLLIVIIVVAVVLLKGGTSASIEALCKADENNADVTGADWKEVGLNLHNKYRKVHHADPMTLSDDLNTRADQCAQHYAGLGTIDHSCGHRGGAGENLYSSGGGSNAASEQEVKAAIKMWYCEVKDYDFKNAGIRGNTGHFTQVVWKGSKELGMGISKKGSQVFVVGLYDPPGNYQTQYEANVLAP